MTQSVRGIQQLLAFSETAKRGSFAEASREIGCTPSTLAKAVRRLEQHLGVRLFHRTTRQVTLTDDGERLFGRCQRVLDELESLEQEASGARTSPMGTLRIHMPVILGYAVMLPLLARMLETCPGLAVDARFSDEYVDLVKDGIDVAIRTGALRDSGLVAHALGSQELLLVASPSYLAARGTPRTLAELATHTGVLFRVPSTGRPRPWELRSGGRAKAIVPASRIQVDSGDAIVHAAVLGLGLGQVPHYMTSEAMARGELVEVLRSSRPAAMPIAAVMPSGRMIPARVRALLDLMHRTQGWLPPAPTSRARTALGKPAQLAKRR
jgi:LysR family transcriptional regulator, regulator for bpeEF and oprC